MLARLKKNRENGRAHLERALTASEFLPSSGSTVPYTQTLRVFLNEYAWKDVITDRNFVLQTLINEMQNIATSVYDFSHLEAGNGVHEFRRKLRWISMGTRGLNGLITMKPFTTPCPVPAWANLINDSIVGTKYAVLPASISEPNSISLSPCLYLKVARLVEDVNQIKAKAEAEESLGEGDSNDLVAIAEQMKVEAMYHEIMDNDLFGLLEAELAAGIITQR